MGRDVTYGIYEQGPGIAPNAGQFDFYVVFPAAVAVFLALSGWVANGLQRWYAALGAIAGAALFAILPYLMAYTGGV